MDTRSEKYKDYCRELSENAPYNTPEKAAKYKEIWERYHGKSIVYQEK